MPITHILFDLDNTLYPDNSGIMQLFDKRISEYVQNFLHLDEQAARERQHHYYTTYGTTLRGLQMQYGDAVDVEDYLRRVHEVELEAFLTLDSELDARLGQLKSQKSIFTNSPVEHAERVLTALGIRQHFQHIFDIRFHEFEPKPSINAYHRVLKALGVSGSETVFLEDSPKNLVPARELGMTTILLHNSPSEAAARLADYVVPDILAALRVVSELEGEER